MFSVKYRFLTFRQQDKHSLVSALALFQLPLHKREEFHPSVLEITLKDEFFMAREAIRTDLHSEGLFSEK